MTTIDDEQRQLEQTCRELVREFADKLPESEVQARFQEILRDYDDAPVRSFVPVLAGRQARERLRNLVAAR